MSKNLLSNNTSSEPNKSTISSIENFHQSKTGRVMKYFQRLIAPLKLSKASQPTQPTLDDDARSAMTQKVAEEIAADNQRKLDILLEYRDIALKNAKDDKEAIAIDDTFEKVLLEKGLYDTYLKYLYPTPTYDDLLKKTQTVDA